jgi:hypothetical protein
MDYNKKKVYELEMECSNRRLSAAGNKFGLVRRLVDDDKQNHQRNLDLDWSNALDGVKQR